MKTVLVRIKPAAATEHRAFPALGLSLRKERGWYEVPAEHADFLREQVLDRHSAGESPRVFDVAEPEAAKVIAESEKKKSDPRGTVEKPIVVAPVAEPEADEGEDEEGEDGDEQLEASAPGALDDASPKASRRQARREKKLAEGTKP